MARPRKYPPVHDLAQLVEAALWRRGPLTIDELSQSVGVPTESTRQAIHHHRNHLSAEDGALLVRPHGNTWRYWMSKDPDEIRTWLGMREAGIETQLRTILAVSETAMRVSAPRSIERKRARIESRLIGRLVEDIEELRAEVTA